MIEVEGLTRYYGEHAAVRDVTFRAEKGEIVGFLGPNGAGKTTTMRMLTCYLPPTRGTARIGGFDILEQSFEVRRRLGYLPESVPLYRDLTVTAYLDFVGRLKEMGRSERIRRIATVMEQCGICEVQGRRIETLSRGYRQRVGVAQALLNDPDVLILDEPTVGLDPRQIVEIRSLIKNLAGERTVVLSTHILPEVNLLCQRVLIINRGVLISDDTVENLGAGLQASRLIEVALRAEPEAALPVLRGVAGVTAVTHTGGRDGVHGYKLETTPGEDPRESVAAAAVGSGMGLVSLGSRGMSLEDIFVRLVAGEEPPHE